ncbi:hypothetical protein ACHAXA_009733 [Cyclostephanos tholiformis]|uniref:GH16 domain-containing protein n=1 Tax=Cyclostephanos tholiformis TaxID=382380 RepID=A0ABD3RAU2_9STRA
MVGLYIYDRLNSYQHCPEDERLNEGIEIGMHGRQSNSFIIELPTPREKRPSLLLFIFVITASFCIAWFISDGLLSTRRRGSHQSNGDGDSIVKKPDSDLDGTEVADEDVNIGRIPDLIWGDEFNGDQVDMTKWTFINGNGCDVGLCGWGNNELELYTPSNTHVARGKLIIEAQQNRGGSGIRYSSSKIVSRGKADFGVVETDVYDEDETAESNEALERSRRFEAKLKLPWGHGIWPAFWMLPTHNMYGGWPKSGEIDIMENVGKEGPNTVHGTVHYGLESPQHQYAESGITISSQKPFFNPSALSGKLNETFHTYSVERQPGIIRWYIDDIEYSSITKADMLPYNWPFDEDFYFIVNLAVGGNWPGNPVDVDSSSRDDITKFPQQLEVDYVRVYEGVFPRIVGKIVVDCSEQDVEYEIVNIETDDETLFTWSVPQNATIKTGQGSRRIVVCFNSKIDGSDILDSEIIHVQASAIDNQSASSSIGLAKIQGNGIGTRVKIVDFNGKCSSMNELYPRLKDYNFDCGRPSTCTAFVLNKTTDEYTCGERIEWLINKLGMNEEEACKEVAYKQFHGHCGPCNPFVRDEQ